jgi:hypothetical protein
MASFDECVCVCVCVFLCGQIVSMQMGCRVVSRRGRMSKVLGARVLACSCCVVGFLSKVPVQQAPWLCICISLHSPSIISHVQREREREGGWR